MLTRAWFAYKTQTLWNFNSQSSQTTIQLPACIQKVINAAKAGQESAINPLSAISGLSLLAQYPLNFISMIRSKDRVWIYNIPDEGICLVIVYFALNQLSLWQYSMFSKWPGQAHLSCLACLYLALKGHVYCAVCVLISIDGSIIFSAWWLHLQSYLIVALCQYPGWIFEISLTSLHKTHLCWSILKKGKNFPDVWLYIPIAHWWGFHALWYHLVEKVF